MVKRSTVLPRVYPLAAMLGQDRETAAGPPALAIRGANMGQAASSEIKTAIDQPTLDRMFVLHDRYLAGVDGGRRLNLNLQPSDLIPLGAPISQMIGWH